MDHVIKMTQLLGQRFYPFWVCLLDEFDRIITQRFQDTSHKSLRFANRHAKACTSNNFTMMPVAVESNLYCYVHSKLVGTLWQLNITDETPLLALALQWHSWQGRKEDLPPDIEVLAVLLKLGADPNHIFEHHSIWQSAIHYLHTMHCLGELSDKLPKWFNAFRMLLQMGADPDIGCFKHDQPCPHMNCSDHLQSNSWCPPHARLTSHSCSWPNNGGISLEDVIRDVFGRKMHLEAMLLIQLVEQKRKAKLVSSVPGMRLPKSRKRKCGRNKRNKRHIRKTGK
jgi:hypothetical protein